MPLQRIILPENHIRVIESKFVSLDRRQFDRTIYAMALDRTSCLWIRNVIPSGPRLIEKSLFPRMLFRLFSLRLFFIGGISGVLLCEKV